jgi:hypothetical protein
VCTPFLITGRLVNQGINGGVSKTVEQYQSKPEPENLAAQILDQIQKVVGPKAD